MIKRLACPSLGGEVRTVPSKSEAHRLLIAAALADSDTELVCAQTNDDINATAACLRSLGARITHDGEAFHVTPLCRDASANRSAPARLECGESGSTLRFLLPLAGALGADADFVMRGRLGERPLYPLDAELTAHGISLERAGDVLRSRGTLSGGDYTIAADVSSQFISGLLFALTVVGGRLTLTGKLESAAYVDMTVDALASFDADIRRDGGVFTVSRRFPLASPSRAVVSGDWSAAAFFLVAGAVGGDAITVRGLDTRSRQGDRAVANILRMMGARVESDGDAVTAYPSRLCAIELNASQIPDLVPVLAVAAAAAHGVTRIYGASRLRLKESDRLSATADMLRSLGAEASVTDDGLLIRGSAAMTGGVVSSAGDHRIAMSAAVAATLARGETVIEGAEAVSKSYPDFWNDYERLTVR